MQDNEIPRPLRRGIVKRLEKDCIPYFPLLNYSCYKWQGILRKLFKITSSKIKHSFLFLIMFSLIIPTNVFGRFPFYLTDDDGLELLKGEKQFSLLFKYTKGFDDELKAQIKEDLTLSLRLIGVETTNWEFGVSYVQVAVMVIRQKNAYYSGSIRVSFNKKAEFFKTLDAFLDQGKAIHTYSVVWNEDIAIINATANKVMQNCQDLFDKFLNDYLKANPGKLKIEKPASKRKLLDLFKDEKSKEIQR